MAVGGWTEEGRSWNRKSQEACLCHRRDSAPAWPAPDGGGGGVSDGGVAEGPGRGLTGEAFEGHRGLRDSGRAGAGWFAGLSFQPPQ